MLGSHFVNGNLLAARSSGLFNAIFHNGAMSDD